MKKQFLEKLLITFCVMLGCMTGYGVVRFTEIGGGNIYNIISHTEDNTLDKEKDGVFFSSKEEAKKLIVESQKDAQVEYIALELVTGEEELHNNEKELEIAISPTITAEPLEIVEEKQTTGQALLVTPIEEPDLDLEEDREEVSKKQEESEEKTEEKTWKANQIIAKAIKDKVEEIKIDETVKTEERSEEQLRETKERTEKEDIPIEVTMIPEEPQLAQAFTYPTEIFGQTPVINRSDEYVTYFEFALDLIETVEAEVKAKGLNETALFAKFVVKALFCGVDVKAIKINEPISRSEAALALWLTAQVMEEKGTKTSATSNMSYVTDLGNCSSSEKKAIAYLYEQGVISGYQISGQTFLPSDDLETKDGTAWMTKIKQCWK